ncbi:uncharacterized protein SCODWIG_03830 [Saccharomycodes ludwigii]|uniref:Beta-mannosyltransferase 1 n=1 Tax=Saccharomycodes ludwigii TaxID=36035 RepID=A0A376BBK2_9ASCO|nr:conserved putative beta-mannosyltransferase [Saccharomycodes ludwigii]KAH3899602.1 conserved putative beta-mannosyltransferase [Saccharomycodes ludwigii]SSD62068.1 uncharacterized protein SCODWIG_03830 [Saccharomycodes ludwigii]
MTTTPSSFKEDFDLAKNSKDLQQEQEQKSLATISTTSSNINTKSNANKNSSRMNISAASRAYLHGFKRLISKPHRKIFFLVVVLILISLGLIMRGVTRNDIYSQYINNSDSGPKKGNDHGMGIAGNIIDTHPKPALVPVKENEFNLVSIEDVNDQVDFDKSVDDKKEKKKKKKKLLRNPKFVFNKSDLFAKLDQDIFDQLKPDWKDTPITNEIINDYTFEKYNIKGYVTNLNGIDPHDTVNTNNHEEVEKFCSKFKYQNYFEYAPESLQSIEEEASLQDLISIRREIITKWPKFKKLLDIHGEKHMAEEDIIRQRWFKFGTSAVWLTEYECYMSVSRVMYAPGGDLTQIKISFGRIQLYDRHWKEIKNRRIFYNDFNIDEEQLRQTFKNIESNLGIIENCPANDPLEYENCVSNNNNLKLIAEKKKIAILDKYSVEFPTLIDVQLGQDQGGFLGSEDPKIITKNYPFEEPYIVFNMKQLDNKRYMHGFYPLRKIDPQIQFTLDSRETQYMEKNWVPFFLQHDESIINNYDRGFIHFIYQFRPLEVLRCSLNDGVCKFTFDVDTLNNFLDSDKDLNKDKLIRGGSQYVSLPSVIPKLSGKNLWVGFPKIHLENCGCGSRFYRPMLSILIEENGVYNEDFIVPIIDFNIDVLGWDRETTKCGGYNVLNPNSISSWDVVNLNEDGTYEDYMTVFLSEADFTSKKLVIKGLLNFIVNTYLNNDIAEHFEITFDSKRALQQSLICISEESKNSCRAYGESHRE